MNSIKEISISPFDDSRWLVSTPDNNHILVNGASKRLLEILRDSESETSALSSFNTEFEQTLNQDDFRDLIESKFGKLDLLSSEREPFKKKTYLSVKIKLISSKPGRMDDAAFQMGLSARFLLVIVFRVFEFPDLVLILLSIF